MNFWGYVRAWARAKKVSQLLHNPKPCAPPQPRARSKHPQPRAPPPPSAPPPNHAVQRGPSPAQAEKNKNLSFKKLFYFLNYSRILLHVEYGKI